MKRCNATRHLLQRRVPLFGLAALLLLLSGCTRVEPVVVSVHDTSMSELAASATQASLTNQRLAWMQEAKLASKISAAARRATQQSYTSMPKGWGQRTSVRYQGDFRNLVQSLCHKAHYHYVVEGRVPASVSLVIIDAKQLPLKSILNLINAQIMPEAQVTLYAKTKSCVVNFKGGRE